MGRGRTNTPVCLDIAESVIICLLARQMLTSYIPQPKEKWNTTSPTTDPCNGNKNWLLRRKCYVMLASTLTSKMVTLKTLKRVCKKSAAKFAPLACVWRINCSVCWLFKYWHKLCQRDAEELAQKHNLILRSHKSANVAQLLMHGKLHHTGPMINDPVWSVAKQVIHDRK